MNFYQNAKSFFRITSVLFILLIAITTDAFSWGGTGHQIINLKSVYKLPSSLSRLRADSLFYAAHASDADNRKNPADTAFFAETPRHYIDIDIYPNFHNLPHSLDSVITIYGRSYVRSQGTLPWATVMVFDSLVAQFKRGDTSKAKLTMSDLGHYVADGHQPLHCTANYDGAQTGNNGIHSRYETSMLGNYLTSLTFPTDSVRYISSPIDYIFDYIYYSQSFVDSIIAADNYAKSVSGGSTSGSAYYAALWSKTGNFTKDLFQRATVALASFWYTAWQNSQSPILSINSKNINYGELFVGNSKQDSVTISNTGGSTLNISSVISSNAEFAVTPSSSLIAPMSNQKFYITFSPVSEGTKNSNLIFAHNGITLKDTVTLTGVSIASAIFTINTKNLNYGEILVGNNKQDSVTITNTGGLTLNISSVTSSNPEFIVTPVTSTIAPTTSQKFYVTFSPVSAGAKTSNIIFAHNGISLKDTVILSGTVVAPSAFIVNTQNLNYGELLIGSSKVDSVTVTNPGSSILTITSVTSSSSNFIVSPVTFAIGPLSSKKFYVTFNPISVGIKSGYLIFTHNGTTSSDTINVTGTGALLSFAATVGTNWNLVSVPLSVSDYTKTVLYPTSVSEAFAFQNAYNAETVLANSVGYWLKFDHPQTLNISGLPLNLDTVAVASGWNLIGSISNSIPVVSINQIPSGIVSSSFYGYQTGYQLADSISPGKGYWVKVNQNGKLVLNSVFMLNKETVKDEQLQTLSRLLIEDKTKNNQIVYFGKADDSFTQKYELPPLPPSGIFDVRYANDNLIASVKKAQTKYIPILISSAEYPVSIACELGDPLVSASLLIDKKEIPLKFNSSVYLNDTRTKVVLKLSDMSSFPKEFMLSQNFPNPFNPTTVINYQLPEPSNVKLHIYDVLGRDVAKLVDGVQESGYKSVTLDGSNLASGIYFYGIEATNLSDPSKSFTQVRKLILMK
jgi:hypothetical protein